MSSVENSTPPAPLPHRPWWVPFTTLGVVLALVGLWMVYWAKDGRFQMVGAIALAGAGIALTGVALSNFRWGRAIMGVSGHRSAWFPWLFTTRGWAQAVVISLAFGTIGFGEYTMHPDFCQSCHIMQPYYQAWHDSTHRGVKCTDCHFLPGLQNTLKGKWEASSMLVRYLTKTYGSMPHAQIQDASCLRSGCHAKRLLEGKINWKLEKPNGAIVNINFDHKPHLTELRRGRQLRCTSCHSQIVQGQHITVTVDTCFVCHFKGLVHNRDQEVLAGCTGCHAAPKEQIRLATGVFNHKPYLDRGVGCYNCHSDSIRGDGAVPRQVCYNCHNKPHQLDRYGETNFIHENHVSKHKLNCTNCHLEIEHSLKPDHALVSGTTCNRCHEQTHGGPAELYAGRGGRGVPDMPSPMSLAQVDCIACHQFKENAGETAAIAGQTYVAAQKSCDMCHGDTPDPAGGKYATKLADWKKALGERIALATESVQRADAALKTSSLTETQKLELARLLGDARHNLALVELGHGVHNFNYAVALLSAAAEWGDKIVRSCAAPVATAAPAPGT
ncbi:MAG: NapC/NirT family cytochrome c [Phycisphaerae bacterium]